MTGTMDPRSVIKKVIKGLNDSIKVISKLERDPSITDVAILQMKGGFNFSDDRSFEKDIMNEFSRINDYRRSYWKLESRIKQSFLSILKKKGYLPGNSPEIESLKNSIPGELIRGDQELWIYSFDHYIHDISNKVGRPVKDAPTGRHIWDTVLKQNNKDVNRIIDYTNKLLPDLYMIKGRLVVYLKDPDRSWSTINVKRPRISPIERPLKKTRIIKRPIPLPKQYKKPRKRVLKRPKHEIIGPEDFD